MHYCNISPQRCISWPLQITIGIIDKVWHEMVDWINYNLEDIDEVERNKREMLMLANIMLRNALQKREEMEKTSSIGLKHQKVWHTKTKNIIKKLPTWFRSNTSLMYTSSCTSSDYTFEIYWFYLKCCTLFGTDTRKSQYN